MADGLWMATWGPMGHGGTRFYFYFLFLVLVRFLLYSICPNSISEILWLLGPYLPQSLPITTRSLSWGFLRVMHRNVQPFRHITTWPRYCTGTRALVDMHWSIDRVDSPANCCKWYHHHHHHHRHHHFSCDRCLKRRGLIASCLLLLYSTQAKIP